MSVDNFLFIKMYLIYVTILLQIGTLNRGKPQILVCLSSFD